MGKEGRRFLPNLKKLGSPRLNFDELSFGGYCFVSRRMCDLETSEGRVAVGEIEQGAEGPLVGCLKTLKVVSIPYGNIKSRGGLWPPPYSILLILQTTR